MSEIPGGSTNHAGSSPVTDTTSTGLTAVVDVPEERRKRRVEALLFFDAANQTQDGKTNILGIFDRLFLAAIPGKTPGFGIFIRTAEVSDGRIEVVVTSPSGERVGGLLLGIDEQPEVARLANVKGSGWPLRVQLLGRLAFEVPEEGVYWFSVHHNGEVIGGTGLIVSLGSEKEDGGKSTGLGN